MNRHITRALRTAVTGAALTAAPLLVQAGNTAAPIPEPDTLALLALGAVAAALLRKSRRK